MKNRWLTPLLLAALWIFAAAVYARLPARIPTHWNVHGEVDRWGGPATVFLLPAIATALAAIFAVLPRLDPRRANWERFRNEVGLILNVLIVFLGFIEVLTVAAGLGYRVPMARVLPAGVGALLMIIGNYLPRVRSNWWIGIRTPWTLESDRVWRDTHRVGGRAFAAGGAGMVAGAFLPAPFHLGMVFVALAVTGVFPVVYSYLVWRRMAAGR